MLLLTGRKNVLCFLCRPASLTGLVISALLGLAPGCAPLPPAVSSEALEERIKPEGAELPAPEQPLPDLPASESADPLLPPPRKAEAATLGPPTIDIAPASRFTVSDAIQFALQNNPRLRIAQQAIEQAQGGRQVALAPFLPHAFGAYRAVGTNSEGNNATGLNEPVVGFGPGTQTFQVAEVNLHWLIWDFGRSQGKFQQAANLVDITQMELFRARQTVAFDVTAAYHRVLLVRATRQVARQSVVRGESFLTLARNLFKQGVVDRNSVLRAEVQLSEAKQALVTAQSAEHVALAGLNFAMGRQVNAPTEIVDLPGEPEFHLSLADSLQLAVGNRREIDITRKWVDSAQQGLRAARAEFMPRVFTQGAFDQVDGRGIQTGATEQAGIYVEVGLFEGGRRLGQNRTANAAVQAAIAQAQLVCDQIAFEVNQAFWAIDDARQRIVLARTATAQAEENLRLVLNKYKAGAATPTDVVDAETTLTRAQQSYYQALYDYQTALARLAYATGTDG